MKIWNMLQHYPKFAKYACVESVVGKCIVDIRVISSVLHCHCKLLNETHREHASRHRLLRKSKFFQLCQLFLFDMLAFHRIEA